MSYRYARFRLLPLLIALSFLAACVGNRTCPPTRPDPWEPHPPPFFAGQPKPASSLQVKVLTTEGYVAGYSEKHQVPLWVSYRLFKVGNTPGLGRISGFRIDNRTDARVSHNHYTGTGYDRGHMAPNSAISRRYGETAWKDTYLMTNICPQTPGLNQRPWERFEHRVSNFYAEELQEVWVTTGPILEGRCLKLDSTRKGRTDVRVPSHFYKIVAAMIDSRVEVLAIVMSQENRDGAPIRSFVTTVDEIESRTRLDFFHLLPDSIENAAEADISPHSSWNVDFELMPTFPGRARGIKVWECEDN